MSLSTLLSKYRLASRIRKGLKTERIETEGVESEGIETKRIESEGIKIRALKEEGKRR